MPVMAMVVVPVPLLSVFLAARLLLFLLFGLFVLAAASLVSVAHHVCALDAKGRRRGGHCCRFLRRRWRGGWGRTVRRGYCGRRRHGSLEPACTPTHFEHQLEGLLLPIWNAETTQTVRGMKTKPLPAKRCGEH